MYVKNECVLYVLYMILYVTVSGLTLMLDDMVM